MAWRNSLREQRRRAILEAAARVFARKGYQRATMREVATEAGISPGTIYLYFHNKRDLLLSIAERLLGELGRLLVQPPEGELRPFISTLLRNQLEMMRRNRPFTRVLLTEVMTDEALRRQYQERVVAPVLAQLEARLRAGVEAGEIRPLNPSIVTRAIVGAVVFLLLSAGEPLGDFLAEDRQEEVVTELTNFFLCGLQPCEEEGNG